MRIRTLAIASALFGALALTGCPNNQPPTKPHDQTTKGKWEKALGATSKEGTQPGEAAKTTAPDTGKGAPQDKDVPKTP